MFSISESSHNCWMRKEKAWYYRGTSYRIPLSKQRGKGEQSTTELQFMLGFTLFAGLGTGLRHPVYKLGGATSKVEVLRFVAALAAAKSDPSQRAYLLCDNHSSHRSLEVQAAIKVHFEPLFIPAYSCQVSDLLHLNEGLSLTASNICSQK